jgi:hypothetical protein
VSEVKPCFTGEVMLAGWADTHNGGAKVTLWLADDHDLECFRRMTVRKGKVAGQRLMCVLVEIDEQENPVNQELADMATKRKPSAEAHLVIMGEHFQRYFRENIRVGQTSTADWDAERIRAAVKSRIGVASLAEIDRDPAARKRYHDLIWLPFSEWAEENPYGERPHDDADAQLAEDEWSTDT